MADFVFIMRGWDPAGTQYKYWRSSIFDAFGADYASSPPFNTLVGIVAVRMTAVAIPPGYSAWAPVFELTSLVDEFTENSAQALGGDVITVTATLAAGGEGTVVQYAKENDHPAYQVDYTSPIAPTLSSSTGEQASLSIHRFEAI